MATTDLTSGTAAFWESKGIILANTVDLTGIATGGVVQALDIPAGWMVTDVWCKVVTAMGLTATATVGDGDGANSWDASVNFNATAGTLTHSAPGTDAYATTGKIYAAADTIDLTCTIAAGPATTGSMTVYAKAYKLY